MIEAERPLAGASWVDPPRSPPSSEGPVLAVDGFEGPLDWLLELARAERIDLRRVSILALVEAFGRALEAALEAGGADLSRWGEFLSMAAHLALLRSRLLLPAEATEAKAARAEAEALRRLLLEGDAMRRAAAWLDGRRLLGRDVFGRGVSAGEQHARTHLGDIADLFRACLVVLLVPELAGEYRPALPPVWRVQDAVLRIRRLLGEGVEGELGAYLPRIAPQGPGYDLRCRAAVASTLVAGLELARAGAVALRQNHPSQPVRVTAVGGLAKS